MPKEETKKSQVAYVAFKTFLNSIDSLGNGLPSVIDRSVWSSLSNATLSQLLIAYRFLGLINREGIPTPDLEKLATDKEHRKATLRRVLERSYPNLIKQNLTKMTINSFHAAMREYGVEGETFKKASSFFLQAARYAELPLSDYVMKETRSVSIRKRRTITNAKKKDLLVREIHGVAEENFAPSGPTKKITLHGGIMLSLSAGADVFKMDAKDRQFVLKLLEEMETYESGLKSPKKETK